jgi:hypothetical protein
MNQSETLNKVKGTYRLADKANHNETVTIP